MKIGVIGAGISGLSFAKLATRKYEVEILEEKDVPGGIARTRTVNGGAYHIIGGHCFNSKYQEVLDFVFNEVLPREEWHLVHRDAVIRFHGREISYPIEYAVKQINAFDEMLAFNITRDFLSAVDDGVYENLEVWFRKKFGNTLADEYFLPYNSKIWNNAPRDMSHSWVEGKLPIPDKRSFFKGLMGSESDMMPHSSFFYPNTNNQNTLIDKLAKGLHIRYNFKVKEIARDDAANKWVVNGSQAYDVLVTTLPMNTVPFLITGTPDEVTRAAKNLKYNKVTTMLWETKDTDRTWTYVPAKDNICHRYIHIGNFFLPRRNLTITEAVGERSYEEMLQNGRRDDFLLTPLDYNVSDHAYVVFDEHYDSSTRTIKNYLEDRELFTLGRFGEWQYYNMDVCMKSAIELYKRLEVKFG